MQDRFKFRAIVKGYYCLDTPEKYEEFEPTIFLEDVDALSNGQIGIQEKDLEWAIREQHPSIEDNNVEFMLEGFRDDSNGVDSYVTITPEVVYQCTGLKDTNGKLIYEGDIVRESFGETGTYRVEYFVYSAEWQYVNLDDEKPNWEMFSIQFEGMSENQGISTDLEIIGNIYENPELIGGAE